MSELPLSTEERLAALEAVVNKLKQPPMDLLLQEGYLQIGSSGTAGSQRFDSNGHQLATGGGEVPGVYFLNKLQADPDTPFVPRGLLQGYGSSGNAYIEMQAQSQDATGKVYITTSDSANSAHVFLYAFSDDLNETALVTLGIRADHSNGLLTVSNAPLYFNDLDDPSPLSNGMIWFNETAGVFKYYEGGSIKTLGGGMSLIVKEADETVNASATSQNDDELLFAVAANEVFQFEGVLMISTNATADFRMTFTGPTGAVGSFSAIGSGGNVAFNAGAQVLGTDETIALSSGVEVVQFWGGIHNGANAGNCTLQWAQGTSTVVDTIVRAGSYLKFQLES